MSFNIVDKTTGETSPIFGGSGSGSSKQSDFSNETINFDFTSQSKIMTKPMIRGAKKIFAIPQEAEIFQAFKVWTDGEDIYLGTTHVLDKTNLTWIEKPMSGSLTNFYSSDYIWQFNGQIFYSLGSTQVFDKETYSWQEKTWSGLSNITGSNVWTNGKDIYYSESTNKLYLLNKNTLEWVLTDVKWAETIGEDFTYFTGANVWTDGKDIYYSKDGINYVYDSNLGYRKEWKPKTWGGLTNFRGKNVWAIGNEIFVNIEKDSGSSYTTTYNLNKETSTWDVVTVEKENGSALYLENNPQNIWSDGKNVYSTVNSSNTFSGGYYLLKTGTADIISTVRCK